MLSCPVPFHCCVIGHQIYFCKCVRQDGLVYSYKIVHPLPFNSVSVKFDVIVLITLKLRTGSCLCQSSASD